MAEYISRDWLLTHTHTGMDTIQMMQTMIDTPAADVVEARHGQWIAVALGDMRCSCCGGVYGVCGGLMGDYNYCPNCGAKMDGGADK